VVDSSSAAATSSDAASGSFLGAYAASNDNVLDDANAYRGITVTRIVDNSPAQAAGLQVGDILLEANGVELDAPERLDDVLEALPPGYSLSLKVERDARVRDFETRTVPRLVAPPLATSSAPPPDSTPPPFDSERRIERRYLGFEFRAAPEARLRALGESPRFGVEVLALAPQSPLRAAQIGVGDLVLELDGRAIPDSEAVIQYFDALGKATDVPAALRLTVVSESGEKRTPAVSLYRPQRQLTRFSLPGLLSIERGRDTSEYSALFGAFRLTRLANGSRLRLLWWLRIETGSPDELIDMGRQA